MMLCERYGHEVTPPSPPPRFHPPHFRLFRFPAYVSLQIDQLPSMHCPIKLASYQHASTCVQVVALANLYPLTADCDELDSWMYQTVGHQMLPAYAAATGLPLLRRRIRGSSQHMVSALETFQTCCSRGAARAARGTMRSAQRGFCRALHTRRRPAMRWRT